MGHRRSPMGYRSLVAIVGAALLAAGPVAGSPAAGAAPPAIHGVVRLDQVGYATGEAKRAFLLAEAPVGTPRFAVVDDAGRTVFTGRVGRWTGGWNGRYRAVHRIDFSALRRPGRYRIVVDGLAAASPAFRVATRHDLFGKLVDDTVRFFQVQRDGAQVPRRLDRRPSHLTDRHATVYATPVFEGDGGDVPAAPLRPVGGPVDVEGGWFDAGDFVKFTHATAYSVAELLLVQRGQHREDHALAAETRHGLRWLDKVWDERHKVLYAQVGLGTGSERFGFVGDHDVWRLPEADDALRVRPGDDEYFIKYRPVFRAAPPGARISPNLAGRVAAAFALGAQVEARRDHQRARALLRAAASVFAMARTTRVGELVTAYPHAYYPEDSWQDDMEFGAVELALAARKLHDRRSAGWLRAATHWARAYLGSEHREALNLYDTSALAHGDLVLALRRIPGAPGFEVSPRDLVGDLRRQLETGAGPARGEPFGSAVDVTQFDAATRTFGYAATARMYRRLTGGPLLRRLRDLPAQLGPRCQHLGHELRHRRRRQVPPVPPASGREPGREPHRWPRRAPGRGGERTQRGGELRGPRHPRRRQGLPGRRPEPVCGLRPPRRALPRRRARLAQCRAGDRLHLHRHARLRAGRHTRLIVQFRSVLPGPGFTGDPGTVPSAFVLLPQGVGAWLEHRSSPLIHSPRSPLGWRWSSPLRRGRGRGWRWCWPRAGPSGWRLSPGVAPRRCSGWGG
jgi:endoglucanase